MKLARLTHFTPRILKSLPDTIFFEGFLGRYADSPRAIAEELQRRGDQRQQVWSLSGDTADVPVGVVVVETGSPAHTQVRQRAGWLVSAITLPPTVIKRRNTRYLQTWHGTPLKRIGADISTPMGSNMRRYVRRACRDAQKWDGLLSPSAYATTAFRSAFEYEGPVLETGYPRNDILSSQSAGVTRDAVRERLGLGDTIAVLYAPTFRDQHATTTGYAGGPRLDVERATDQLGADYRLLLRLHPGISTTWQGRENPGIVDVSHWPDIRDLYLAADVLVTDYSSVMFDFAVTQKPIIFFVDDLEEYGTKTRGFYFDLFADPPGPVAHTYDDLIDHLLDIPAVAAKWTEAYERFRTKFCPHEDGKAASRVVASFF